MVSDPRGHVCLDVCLEPRRPLAGAERALADWRQGPRAATAAAGRAERRGREPPAVLCPGTNETRTLL